MEMVEEETNQTKKASSKRLKIKENKEEDRISSLPDCLILHILSLLPSTKSAIRTGTLSKRWISLWISTPTLIFKQKELVRCGSDDRLLYDFVSFVSKTVTQCRHSKLNEFKVVMECDNQFESQVNDWVRYAISCNVEELILKLTNFKTMDECTLDDQFFSNSCFTHLKLQGIRFNPSGLISWKSLRSLCISYAKLDEEFIKNILSGSPLLETLMLTFCYGYRRLDITSKSVKNLLIRGYHNPYDHAGVDVIAINAPNILFLKIHSLLLLWKLLLVDVSSLVKVELDYKKFGFWETTREEDEEKMLKGLMQNLLHVKHLKVGISIFTILARLDFPDVTLASYFDSDSCFHCVD